MSAGNFGGEQGLTVQPAQGGPFKKHQTKKNRPLSAGFLYPPSKPQRRETRIRLERVKGIEPSLSAWEAGVMPLYDTRSERLTLYQMWARI